jgi:hypothetical protein
MVVHVIDVDSLEINGIKQGFSKAEVMPVQFTGMLKMGTKKEPGSISVSLPNTWLNCLVHDMLSNKKKSRFLLVRMSD